MEKGKDYIGVGVGAVIVGKAGKVFASQRGPLSRNEAGKWEFPGGSVEFGETLEHAIVREMREEYGVSVKPVRLLCVADHILPREGPQHWVSPTFICRLVRGEPKILEPGKCGAIGWFTIKELAQMPLSAITRNDLAWLKKSKFASGVKQ